MKKHFTAFKMIKQTAWCCDQHIHTFAKGGILIRKADPPMSSAILILWLAENFSNDSATCAANSLVGAKISERGMRALARPDAKMSIIGRVKDAVLPVPVCADPSMSRPIRTLGIEAA